MFKIQSGQELWEGLSYERMRLVESFYRGNRQSYIVTYPDGYKIESKAND